MIRVENHQMWGCKCGPRTSRLKDFGETVSATGRSIAVRCTECGSTGLVRHKFPVGGDFEETVDGCLTVYDLFKKE
jgi:hypothetical protein